MGLNKVKTRFSDHLRITQLVCFSLVLFACGADTKTHPNPVPQTGGTLKMIIYPPATLDPASDLSVYESFMVNQLYEGLLELDESLNPMPALADFWTIDSSYTHIKLHLRQGVIFQNGTPLTAAIVRKSLLRLIHLDNIRHTAVHHFITEITGVADWLNGASSSVSGIRVLDSSHLEVDLSSGTPDFLYFFSSDQAKIVIPSGSAGSRRLVGAGPFELGAVTDSVTLLQPYPDYYRGRAYLDSILLYTDNNATEESAFEMLLNHRLNFIESPLWGLDSLAEYPGIKTQKRLGLEIDFIGIRTDRGPLRNRKFRQLLFQAVDWDKLQVADLPYFKRAAGVIPPGLPGYRENLIHPLLDPRRHIDPESALPKSFKDSLIYGMTDTVYVGSEDDMIITAWQKLGIPLKWPPYTWTTFNKALNGGALDFFVMGWVVEVPSTPRYLYNLFHSKGVANYFAYKNPTVDSLIEKALSSTDRTQQILWCQAAEDIILKDAPILPSNYVFTAFAYDASLQGIKLSALGISILRCENLWFASKAAR